MKAGKPIEQSCDRAEALRAFTLRDELDGKSLAEAISNSLEDSRLRYNKERAAQAGPL
jgi:hypothetical protein